MHKISNFTGQAARHGWDKIPQMASFGMSRSHNDLPATAAMKRPAHAGSNPGSHAIAPGAQVNLSFNVPFKSHLQGPEAEDVLYASPGAFDRWTHPAGTAENAPIYELPVHNQHVENLRTLCKEMSDRSEGLIHANVMSSEPRPVPGFQRGPLRALITNVCLSGEVELANRMRCRILTESPISLRCSTVDIDNTLILDGTGDNVKAEFLGQLDEISRLTKADLFLLVPKQPDIETASFNGTLETVNRPQKFKCAIYGDYETTDTAKTRVLILIDRILGRHVDAMRLELSMHTLICGRGRKNIKLIESITNTAIYFPPPFPRLYGYSPPGAQRRPDDQIIITGVRVEDIMKAKKRLHDLVINTKAFHKGVVVTETKIDSIILERLDKVRKIMENNGSYVVFPSLGMQRGIVRVQGTDVLNVERTVRELMTLAGQFYSATWSVAQLDNSLRAPTAEDIRAMLADICINSGAEIHLELLNYHIYGSDDAVKAALHVISNLGFINSAAYTLSVKIELANEHKEFVSGKKNGKINKIMSHSSVQIVFDGFNEYNFYIVVRGQQYDATKNGLDLVEQEMPAAISFHVPDQYHKRIIGIGGQHIQRIMKKYSVFVKFSNAMDRGGMGKEDDDIKVDNVICRTPARNAQNLDLVKQEIMDMVEKGDAELVQEKVVIDRLYHRELIARMPEIEGLEKKWNCKITFPSTEEASDFVQIAGPEYQVPLAVDEFLGMVPESHEIAYATTTELSEFTRSQEFQDEVVSKLKSQYVVDVRPHEIRQSTPDSSDTAIEGLILNYTRNNAGGLKDAIDFLITRLVAHGLDASTVKGAIPRPKSDSFEDSLPYFNSKLLPKTTPSIEVPAVDSPTRSQFGGDEPAERSGFLDRLRKPGSTSSFSSILQRRKNSSNSPGSLFKHASSNASKASLVSLESNGSYRNPWNDSGINLPDEEPHNGWHMPPPPSSSHSQHKFPFGMTSAGVPGDVTPRYDPRASVDSGRPSTSHSASGYPAPIGPPR